MKKFDKKFILENKELVINKSKENAKRLYEDAKLLMRNKRYASALGRIIEALEELAKISLIKKDNFSSLDKLVSHGQKAKEMISLSAELYGIKNISREKIEWAQQRIPKMREDSTYVRLVPTQGNKIKPDNKYWQKRAKSFFKFLSDVINKFSSTK